MFRPLARSLSLLALVALGGAATALSSSPPAPAQVLAIVDALPLEGELDAAIEQLEEAGVTPEYLRQVLVEGRTYEAVEPGTKRIQVEDAYGRSTEVVLVVPRGYDPKKRASGLIVCLHGLGGEGEQVVDLYRDFAEDQGLLLVCPTAQPLPADRPHPDTKIMEQFPQLSSTHWWSYWSGSFPLSLLRHLSREYRLDRDRVVLSGYSMGGFGTWNIGMRFPDRFAAVLPMAGGISGLEYLGSEDRSMRSLIENLVEVPVYFIHGDADSTVPVRFDQSTERQLGELGSRNHVYVQVPGGSHMLDVQPGGKLMRDACKWLASQERDSDARQIVHCALDPDHGACRWISIDELSGTVGKVQARLKGSGKFEIATEGVAALTVRVNQSVAKLDKVVTVKLNGKSAFKGKVTPSLRDLLSTWRESEDPALLYDASITLRP